MERLAVRRGREQVADQSIASGTALMRLVRRDQSVLDGEVDGQIEVGNARPRTRWSRTTPVDVGRDSA